MPSAKLESRDPTEEINWPAQISRKSCRCANRLRGMFFDFVSGSNPEGCYASRWLRHEECAKDRGSMAEAPRHSMICPAQDFDMRRSHHGVMVSRHCVDVQQVIRAHNVPNPEMEITAVVPRPLAGHKQMHRDPDGPWGVSLHYLQMVFELAAFRTCLIGSKMDRNYPACAHGAIVL